MYLLWFDKQFAIWTWQHVDLWIEHFKKSANKFCVSHHLITRLWIFKFLFFVAIPFPKMFSSNRKKPAKNEGLSRKSQSIRSFADPSWRRWDQHWSSETKGGFGQISRELSNEKKTGWLFCIRDYTTQLYRSWFDSKAALEGCDMMWNWRVVSNIFYFHPENWGRFPFWRAYFWKGLVQPPTRRELDRDISSHNMVLYGTGMI